MVKLYEMGEPVGVVVDDQLSDLSNFFSAGKDRLQKVSLTGDKAWWLPILEKAYARFNINFANMNGRFFLESSRELTGMPAVKLEVKDNQRRFRTFQHDS